MPVSTASSPQTAAKKRTPIYSFEWATGVVIQATKKYPRAWDFLGDFLGLNPLQLAYLVACNDPVWPAIRTMVHTVAKWQAKQEEVGPDNAKTLPSLAVLYQVLLKQSKNTLPESFLRYLTDQIVRITLKEQLKQGGVEALADPPSFSPRSPRIGRQYELEFGETDGGESPAESS
jgi:hypothetical protein